jgi:hypothetical protein
MKYFTFFPKKDYEFPNGLKLKTMDIFLRPELNFSQISGINSTGVQYVAEDGKSPDLISKEIYGYTDYFWSILNSNNIIDFYKEWPVSYSGWKKELFETNADITIFSRYALDIKEGDIVSLFLVDDIFDKNNYGVVTSYNKFLRAIDIKMVRGEIKNGNRIVIAREISRNYSIIQTPEEISQLVVKTTSKFDSAVSFMKSDPLTGALVMISPYYSMSTGNIVNDGVSDILATDLTTILSIYLQDRMEEYNNIKAETFLEKEENKWVFKKKVSIIPSGFLREANNIYLNAINKESESL